MTARSRQDLIDAVTSGIADNTSGDITPAVHRPILLDILDSLLTATPLMAGSIDITSQTDWLTATELDDLPDAFLVEGYVVVGTDIHDVPHQTLRKARVISTNTVIVTASQNDRIDITVTAAGVVQAHSTGVDGTWHWWIRPAGPDAVP